MSAGWCARYMNAHLLPTVANDHPTVNVAGTGREPSHIRDARRRVARTVVAQCDYAPRSVAIPSTLRTPRAVATTPSRFSIIGRVSLLSA